MHNKEHYKRSYMRMRSVQYIEKEKPSSADYALQLIQKQKISWDAVQFGSTRFTIPFTWMTATNRVSVVPVVNFVIVMVGVVVVVHIVMVFDVGMPVANIVVVWDRVWVGTGKELRVHVVRPLRK